MGDYNKHPILTDIRSKYFGYSPNMFPFQFKKFFTNCPVHVAGGNHRHASITMYRAGTSAYYHGEKGNLVTQIRKHYGNKIAPELKDWLSTSRPTAVFAGHGLPEEISLCCSLAIASGHVTASEMSAWATKWIGLDCNGFTNAYFTSIGTFSRPRNYHPSYVQITREARTISEITYDCAVLWADKETTDGSAKVAPNPNHKNAHIAVTDGWNEYGSSLWISERGGSSRFKGHVGIHTGIYDIVAAPKAGCSAGAAVWKLKSREKSSAEYVFITRRMQSY